MKHSDSWTDISQFIRPGDYDTSLTENIDKQGKCCYTILLSPKSDNSPRPTSDHGYSQTPNHLDKIRAAIGERSEETEFLTYPGQGDSFRTNFIKMRDRARNAFRQSTASDDDIEKFEWRMLSDDELFEMAALIRRLYSMGLLSSGIAFCDYVDEAHQDALEYAEKALCG